MSEQQSQSYTKKVVAGAVAVAFVLGAAAATLTTSAAPATHVQRMLQTNTGVANTYGFTSQTGETYDFDDCDKLCVSQPAPEGPGQMPCITSYDMTKQMVGDIFKADYDVGTESWLSYKNGQWGCEHLSYNTKLSFYYNYVHWNPEVSEADIADGGCGVVKANDMDEEGKEDGNWFIVGCNKKKVCTCQGSSNFKF